MELDIVLMAKDIIENCMSLIFCPLCIPSPNPSPS